MKLVACSNCHTQYDVGEMAPASIFSCRCGTDVQVVASRGADAPVQRCSACGALAREEDENCSYCESSIVLVGDRGSLICPECFARNADDGRFCLACGVGFDPEPIRSEKTELRCPCCERWMATGVVGGLEFQECEKCHGLWAPEDRFDALVGRATEQTREKAASGEQAAPRVDGGNPARAKVEYRRCPECDTLMGRRNFQKRSGVIIDRCPQHGTWLDVHELERIAGFVLSGRAERAARMVAADESDRERAAARQAAQRITLGSEYGNSTSMFRPHGETRTIGTVLDLLRSILA